MQAIKKLLLYLRNCISIIGMESPIHRKVVCNVFLPGKFERDLSNMEVNRENLRGKSRSL